MIPPVVRIELLILGEVDNLDRPGATQIIASARPDLTAEQWRKVGQALLETLGAEKVSEILVEEGQDGLPVFTNVPPKSERS